MSPLPSESRVPDGGQECPPHEPMRLAPTLARISGSVPKKAAAAWAQFTATIAQLSAPELRAKTDAMIRLVLEAGYEDYLKATYPNFRQRLEDLEQLASFARQFPTMEDFLTHLALLTNVEAEDDKPRVDDHEKIRLSSIHQAKGLEFRVVFVIMLCDGLFPSARSVDNPEGEEEERRLFYVAITRARRHLLLTWSRSRQPGGRGTRQRSRFLDALAPDIAGDALAPRSSVRRGRGGRPATRREPAACRSCGRSLVTGAERARMRCRTCPQTASEATVDRLRTWRLERAREREVPAYVIFTDATMEALAETLPRDTDELLAISGIGPDKVERYGDALLELLAESRDYEPGHGAIEVP